MSLNLPKVVFFGRTLEEYERFWMLPIDAFPKGPILDCPSGPTDFIARARNAGLNVTGVDPAYAMRPDELATMGRRDIALTVEAIRAQGNVLAGPTPDAWAEAKESALQHFLEDYRHHHPQSPAADGRYCAAALPDLPFPDRHFDLVLSGHLLFCYAAVGEGGLASPEAGFDLGWHLDAIDELARVTGKELRLYPVTRVDVPAGTSETVEAVETAGTSETARTPGAAPKGTALPASDWPGDKTIHDGQAAGAPLSQHPYLMPLCDRLIAHGFTIGLATPDFDQGCERTGSLLIARRRQH